MIRQRNRGKSARRNRKIARVWMNRMSFFRRLAFVMTGI